MECGSQDAVCQLTTWLSENELATGWLVESLGRFGASANGVIGALSQFVKEYGQSIIGLVGVSFGFWRWWRYREHILHKRLDEYLKESDGRLAHGTAQILEAIQRPAPGQRAGDPLFVNRDLRTVLRERNWDNAVLALSVETSADWQLSKAIDSITRRLSTAHALTASLHRQLTSAHSIRGAIAASRADRTKSGEFYTRALNFFRSALSVPGNERNLVLKELEAHQQRKLKIAAAEKAYEDLIELAKGIEDVRDRDLTLARAKRFSAEIVFSNLPLNAWRMMTAPVQGAQYSPGALNLIENCEPLTAWERLEKGDTHYFAALCANAQGFVAAEPYQLGEAEAAYRRILIELSDRRHRWPRRFRRLRARATKGIARVLEAKKGNYDANWLPA
jgi:tetratricopeptide (TPR) repeat protein